MYAYVILFWTPILRIFGAISGLGEVDFLIENPYTNQASSNIRVDHTSLPGKQNSYVQ